MRRIVGSAIVAACAFSALAVTPQFTYYRFKVEASVDSSAKMMQLSELKLFCGDVDVTSHRSGLLYDNTTKTTDNQTFPGNENPDCAVDGNAGTKWLDFRCSVDEEQSIRDAVWITVAFPAPQRVTKYEWYVANDAAERNPSSWRFQGSDDNSNWVDLDVRQNFYVWDKWFQCAYSCDLTKAQIGTFPYATAEAYVLQDDTSENSYVGIMRPSDNLLRSEGVTAAFTEGDHSWYNNGDYYELKNEEISCLTDGKIPIHRNQKPDDGASDNLWDDRYESRVLIPKGSKMTWTWTAPKRLENVKLYTQWHDAWRNDVAIEGIEVQISGGQWKTLRNSKFNAARYSNLNDVCPYLGEKPTRMVTFMNSGDAPLADYVTGLRIIFGNQSNDICYGAYWEIEAKGSAMPEESLSKPVLLFDEMTPGYVDASFPFEIASIGAEATSWAVNVEYGTTTALGSTANIANGTVAETATESLSGLSCGTGYYAKLVARNNLNASTETQVFKFRTGNALDSHLATPAVESAVISGVSSVASVTPTLRYGISGQELGNSIQATVGQDGKFSFAIDGLSMDSCYDYEVLLSNGNDIVGRGLGSFTTLGYIDHDAKCSSANGVYSRDRYFGIVKFVGNGYVKFNQPMLVDVLLVGGGGGGGTILGGGGGGGGVVYRQSYSVAAGEYDVTVGDGGTGATWDGVVPSTNGGNSLFADLAAVGGGAGGGSQYTDGGNYNGRSSGVDGGSGGGAGGHSPSDATLVFGQGTPNQGYAGGSAYVDNGSITDGGGAYRGAGGGGGGAGGAGQNAVPDTENKSVSGGTGGVGVSCAITGVTVFYGGGGGGGSDLAGGSDVRAVGGAGGGGAGGWLNSGTNLAEPGSNGVNGLGGGGGGGGQSWWNGSNETKTSRGGDGGSGVVIIRYKVTPHGAALFVR